MGFSDWCDSADTQVGIHFTRVLTSRPADINTGIEATAMEVPSHYASEERIAAALASLGKTAAAKMITDLLPQTKKIRSGDLGEILATEWIQTESQYQVPIKRLRWKDHREMAMRGDDVIGMSLDSETQRLSFLKTEAKSRIALSAQTLLEARNGLEKDNGMPSSHALSFISARLFELRTDLPLQNAIDNALYLHGIQPSSVRHLIFTLSGNSPQKLLIEDIQAYSGVIQQWAVGLHLNNHATFIGAVYDKVISDANQP